VGMVVGWTLGRGFLATSGWVSRLLESPPISDLALGPAGFWAAVVGSVGLLLGWYRGLEQHPAWSTPYALGRWLLRLLAWGTVLSLIAVAACWSWMSLGPDLADALPQAASSSQVMGAAVLLALAAAMLPATIGQLRSARPPEAPGEAMVGASRRSFVRMGVGLALVLLLVLGAPLGAKAWQQGDVDRAWSAGRQLVSEQWGHLYEKMEGLMEGLDLSIVTGREPEATPYPTRVPARPPVEKGAAP
jgi:hypothetical protein